MKQARDTLLFIADKGKREIAARRNRKGVERVCRRQKSPSGEERKTRKEWSAIIWRVCIFDRPACQKCFCVTFGKSNKRGASRWYFPNHECSGRHHDLALYLALNCFRLEVKDLLKRTISVMVGKGSVNHNSRKFHAKNTDPERSDRNIEYCNRDIREVYHELFDEALERYNRKQTRKDRQINDYYEKICRGKQEKPFHEVILQIGNKDDMGAQSEDGLLAAKVLDRYMKGFQKRNPNLCVFSAHLHMDEATPHLHIDFVPFIAGSKRGLDTRVSLKQALAALGFKGGTRSETEWNQWVAAEKRELAVIMQQYDIEWEQKGTHEKHLSVLDFEKRERSREVAALEEKISTLKENKDYFASLEEKIHGQLCDTDDELREAIEKRIEADKEAEEAEEKAISVKKRLSALTSNMSKIENFAAKYTHPPEQWLPEAITLESAKSYRKRIIPILKNVVQLIRPVYAAYLQLKKKCLQLSNCNEDLEERIGRVNESLSRLQAENARLRSHVTDYERVRAIYGPQAVDEAIQTAKQYERMYLQQKQNKRKHDRGAR